MLMATIPATLQAESAIYLRQPSLSPDNQSIAFSYRGDIWRVSTQGGLATRLTTHPGRDQRPIWSPAGDQIAFTSDREGQGDVYIMPASGGAPSRLTYQTGHDYPCDWSPDGAHILTESYTGWRPDLVEYPVAGGPARPVTGVPMEGEYFARYGADSTSIVLCDGAGYVRWWREGSRTARAGQVWTLKRGSWPPEMNRVTGVDRRHQGEPDVARRRPPAAAGQVAGGGRAAHSSPRKARCWSDANSASLVSAADASFARTRGIAPSACSYRRWDSIGGRSILSEAILNKASFPIVACPVFAEI